MAFTEDWREAHRIDLQLRELHLRDCGGRLERFPNETVSRMLPELSAAVVSLGRVIESNVETPKELAVAKHAAVDAALRLRAVEQAGGTVLSGRTRVKCWQLDQEILAVFGSENVDLVLLWEMMLHVFDHALAETQAAAGKGP